MGLDRYITPTVNDYSNSMHSSDNYALEGRCANGYCSEVGGKVRDWDKLCICLMGNV